MEWIVQVSKIQGQVQGTFKSLPMIDKKKFQFLRQNQISTQQPRSLVEPVLKLNEKLLADKASKKEHLM